MLDPGSVKYFIFLMVTKSKLKYFSSALKKEILPFAITWMNSEEIMLNEINQTERQIGMISFMCRILNRKQNKK